LGERFAGLYFKAAHRVWGRTPNSIKGQGKEVCAFRADIPALNGEVLRANSIKFIDMNKAFVKEQDNDDDDELPEAAALPKGTRNYLTPGGYAALRSELIKLMNEERPAMVQIVSWAASNGDRSENGDYLYGKKRLREIDRRMRFLTKRLELAEIVDPAAQQNRDQVFFGATVLYADQTGLERRVTIVGVDEAEPLNGKISWISPVARALNKARVGDTITLRTPGGVDELDILEVSYADA